MARFIVISDRFLITLPHQEATNGHTYIDRQKIVSVKTSGGSSNEKTLTIRTLDGEALGFLYDETHPEWITLFSWLNK